MVFDEVLDVLCGPFYGFVDVLVEASEGEVGEVDVSPGNDVDVNVDVD